MTIDMRSGMFTSLSGEWETPQELYDLLDRDFRFDMDAAATRENTKAPVCPRDGLLQQWFGRVYLNPPYGREIGKWMLRVLEERWVTELIVALLPSRTDTRWWHEVVMKADRIYFIKGRLKFSNHKNSAPFPSAIAIWKGRHYIPDDNIEKWL